MAGRGPRGRARIREAQQAPSQVAPEPPVPIAEGGRGRGYTPRIEPSESVTSVTSTISTHSPSESSNGEQKRESPPQTTLAAGRAALRGKTSSTVTNVESSLIDPLTRMNLQGPSDVQERVPQREYKIESVPVTRPASCTDKRGTTGRRIKLLTNFYEVLSQPNWILYQYHVDFNPPIESRRMRGGLLNMHAELFNNKKAFDGSTLYSLTKLPNEVTEKISKRITDNVDIKITIKRVGEIVPTSPNFVHLFNVVFRRCLQHFGMSQIGRNYYDLSVSVPVEKYNLEIVNGFITAIASYEMRLMLCAEVSHRLINTQTVYDLMDTYYAKSRQNFKELCTQNIIGQIVMTRYNNKTYRVDDINWDITPSTTFDRSNGSQISFIDYYKQAYNITIKAAEQPMLISMPKQSDKRRGDPKQVLLVPELCVITGVTDSMREDNMMMRELATLTRVNPDGRSQRLTKFVNDINKHPKVKEELSKWEMEFSSRPVEVEGRVFEPEVLKFGTGTKKVERADWTNEMKTQKHITPMPLKNWIILYSSRDENYAIQFSDQLHQVTRSMGINVSEPIPIRLSDDRTEQFINALKQHVKKDTDLVVCVLPSNRKDRYDAIKRYCCLECPVPSQVILSKNLRDPRKALGVMTKVAVQINCKLGGEIWAVSIPLAKTMICGIDTYHDSQKKGCSVCAFVATTNPLHTKFFSRATLQDTHQELSNNLTLIVKSAVLHFAKANQDLPEKIVIFRDGISDGQLPLVTDYEIPQILKSFELIKPGYNPKLAFVVVKKRGNARFFQRAADGQLGNPQYGTVIDNTITRAEWFDFYLISQATNQGTVNPTHYNVVWNTFGLLPDHFQQLSHKLTHMYYNWSGTIRVPALCQYAHKLAFLVGQSLHREHRQELCDKLYYL